TRRGGKDLKRRQLPNALHASSQGQRLQRDVCACWLRAAFYSNPRLDETRALVFTRGDACRSGSTGGATRAGNGKAVRRGDFATCAALKCCKLQPVVE